MAIIKKVAVGLSGGVDSAVSAYLLKKKGMISLIYFCFTQLDFPEGFEIIGLYMKNWDERDEKGFCSSDKDFEDAVYVSKKLDIPIKQVNYVKEFWNDVFRYMIFLLLYI